MTLPEEIDAAKRELDALVPPSRATQQAGDLVGGISTTVSQIDTISSTYLEPLKVFNTVVSTIANVLYYILLGVTSKMTFIHRSTLTLRWHWGFSPVPLRCAVWLAETCISHYCQVIIRQANLDHSVSSLHSKIQSVYELLLKDTKALDMMKDTLTCIAQVVSSCAQFIANYSKDENFCTPLRILLSRSSNYHLSETSCKEHLFRRTVRRQRIQQGSGWIDARIPRSRSTRDAHQRPPCA